MAKAYDVPADLLINKLSEILKSEDITPPNWIPFVKTGSHAQKPPQQSDWYYTRCASLLRKIYLHGPIGIQDLRTMHGGTKAVGYGGAPHRDVGVAIIRTAMLKLQKLCDLSITEANGTSRHPLSS